MKLLWSETSKKDLMAIHRYIAKNNPTAAQHWIKRLKAKARNIVYSPRTGRIVPELSRDDLREMIEKHYRIVYQLRSDRVTILTVFESHQILPVKNIADIM